MTRSLDWFPFYVKDWLTSHTVRSLTLEHQGLFVRMLAEAWVGGGSLPADHQQLARLLGCDAVAIGSAMAGPLADAWQTVNGRLVNHRLTHEYEVAEKRAVDKSEAGRRGAEARWRPKNGGADGSRMAEPLAVPSRNGMHSTGQDSTGQDKKGGRDANAPASSADADRAEPKLAWDQFDPQPHCEAELWARYCRRLRIGPRSKAGWTKQAKALGWLYASGGEPALEDWCAWSESLPRPKPISHDSAQVTIAKRERRPGQPPRRENRNHSAITDEAREAIKRNIIRL